MVEIKKFFPILDENPDVVYLDSAASAQKPLVVLESMDKFYRQSYANIHRGLYKWSENATELYEEVREKVALFLGAKKKEEIVFTRGTTDAINLLAGVYREILKPGDVVMVCEGEHHSNLLPWKNACEKTGASIVYIPVSDDGEIDYEWIKENLSSNVKLVCVAGQSNVLGVKNDVVRITDLAHKFGAKVLVDGAQLTAHTKVDVSALDVDFYAFSGHKIYGPTGIGCLYGKYDDLQKFSPYQYGGDMVESVALDKVVFKDAPSKFEAGTPPIAEVVGFGAAIDFLNSLNWEEIEKQSYELTQYTYKKLSEIEGVKFISAKNSDGIVAFVIDGVSSFDIGYALARKNICVRVGKHCAEPLHKRFGVDSSIRVSFGIYNTKEDVDKFISVLKGALLLLK